jgi:hypothetical protein
MSAAGSEYYHRVAVDVEMFIPQNNIRHSTPGTKENYKKNFKIFFTLTDI